MAAVSPGQRERRQLELREKWNTLLSSFARSPGGVEKSLRDMENLIVSEGVAEGPLRSRIWMMISGAAEKKQSNPTVYQHLVHIPLKLELNEQIRMDSKRLRLLPGLKQTADDVLLDRAVSVTRLYCAFDPRVGYVQGMLYLAILIITVTDDEENSFWLFCTILTNYGFRELMDRTSSALFDILNDFDKMLRHQLPSLHAHMLAQQCPPSTYAVDCFTSCFVVSMPLDTVLRIWDLLLMRIEKVLPRVLLSVLSRHQEQLLTMSLEEILPFLKLSLATSDDSILLPLLHHNEWLSRADSSIKRVFHRRKT